jgi:hypothetical protein
MRRAHESWYCVPAWVERPEVDVGTMFEPQFLKMRFDRGNKSAKLCIARVFVGHFEGPS